MIRRAFFALALLPAACSSPRAEEPPPAEPAAPPGPAPHTVLEAAPEADAGGVAYFAGGCFWGVEYYLEAMPGVLDVQSGYMGGHLDNPTYAQVTSHVSGHLEAVKVEYDPDKVGYADIAQRFFEIHDPTQKNGQGPDIGPQYKSAVFYANDAQKDAAHKLIEILEARGYDVATELRPADTFWIAEGYHQDYYAGNGKTPYCHARVRRFDD